MEIEAVVAMSRTMLQEVVILVGPILAVAIAVSLLVNVMQVLTSLQDQTLSSVPRLLATGATVFVMMPWMLRHLVAYTVQVFGNLQKVLQ